MKNLLLENVEYKIGTTNFGVWRRFVYPNGAYFAEFKSHATFWGLPLFHYTRGKCPETGRRIIAKGVIAVGRLATGIVAIGHASFGLIAIGQLAYGKYVLAQLGYGEYVWSQNRADPEAVIFLIISIQVHLIMPGLINLC
jgi:hypothetical protein